MRIRLKLTLVFLAFALLLTLLFYFIGLHGQNRILNEMSLNDNRHLHDLFYTLEERDIKILSSALEAIVRDPGIKSVYLEKDREKMYNYEQPLFQNLKDRSGITHFYFILPDGRVFIRMHGKEIYGDIVTRLTFQEARDTKKLSSGIELGKTAFALRAVMPYYKDSELIGYVELGEEIDHFLKILKGSTSNEFVIVADKAHLSREDWKSVRQAAGLRDNWDDSEKHLILGSTTKEESTSKCFAEGTLELIEEEKNHFSGFQAKNKTFTCGGFTITDAKGQHVGAVLSLMDITNQAALAQKSNYTLIIMSIILFFTTLAIGALISASISKSIKKLNEGASGIGKGNLDFKVNVKTKDELGVLADTFNSMAGELKNLKHVEKLNKLKKELEALESSRITGFISEESYQKEKKRIGEKLEIGKK